MSKRILIVDDEAPIREMVNFALSRAGYECLQAPDDYVTKPFSLRELIARIKAVLRRTSPDETEQVEVRGLKLDATSHRVTANGEQVEMGPTEFRLLRFLMAHPDRVYSRGQLLDRVWGNTVYIEERTVDVTAAFCVN